MTQIGEYITLDEWAARLGVSTRRARVLAVKIPGAKKIGRVWFVPNDAFDIRRPYKRGVRKSVK